MKKNKSTTLEIPNQIDPAQKEDLIALLVPYFERRLNSLLVPYFMTITKIVPLF